MTNIIFLLVLSIQCSPNLMKTNKTGMMSKTKNKDLSSAKAAAASLTSRKISVAQPGLEYANVNKTH